jgi:hypothetical protein
MLRAATGRGNPVADFAEVAHLAFDLDAEGFADTTAIGTLTDQTGNSRDATQATGTKQPLAQTVSGMKVARFDGTDDWLRTAAFTAVSQPTTYVFLYKYRVHRPSGNKYILDGLSAVDRHYFITHDGDWLVHAGYELIGGVADTDWHVHTFVLNGASSSHYIDGALESSGDVGSRGIDGFTIGTYFVPAAQYQFDGDLAYLGMYDGDLATDDLTLLNNTCQALADRAGITWTDIT